MSTPYLYCLKIALLGDYWQGVAFIGNEEVGSSILLTSSKKNGLTMRFKAVFLCLYIFCFVRFLTVFLVVELSKKLSECVLTLILFRLTF